jgi:hypothetical protein
MVAVVGAPHADSQKAVREKIRSKFFQDMGKPGII